MTNRDKVLLGALAGASFAIGYWLNSDDGRTFRKDAQDTVSDAYDRGQETARQAIDTTTDKVNDVIDTSVDMMKKAKEMASNAEKKAREKIGA